MSAEAEKLREAMYAVEMDGGRTDRRPWDKAIAAAICDSLGITRGRVDSLGACVYLLDRDIDKSDADHVVDALFSLLEVAGR